jgi:hypothetical protein
MRAIVFLVLAVGVAGAGCGDDTTSSNAAADMAVATSGDMSGGDMTLLNHGCPPLTTPQDVDGGAAGDTWTNYAQGFFTMWCTRCHSTTLAGAARNGAPDGYNWDDQAAVNAHLAEIRDAVGVSNFMPFTPPDPTCADRQRIVRWIDANAP